MSHDRVTVNNVVGRAGIPEPFSFDTDIDIRAQVRANLAAAPQVYSFEAEDAYTPNRIVVFYRLTAAGTWVTRSVHLHADDVSGEGVIWTWTGDELSSGRASDDGYPPVWLPRIVDSLRPHN